ncbi:MAG: hypothetical protein DI536_23110 [Archangium gephyra]|uniref:Uncharacterized protein n=1 Tax=Archangium gephyra TaxID=48 RepID=A0A2W5TCK5_9BACT|nr:MAG: hypothetical protein DI536_23110 [Archangium gephyra]
MFIAVYLRLYARAFVDALASIGRSAWTLLLPMGIVFAFGLAATLVSPLGFAGGFVMAFVQAGLLSAYSYFLSMLVNGNKAGIDELKKSVGAYFFNWISFSFVLFMIDLGLDIATRNNPQGRPLMLVVKLIELIALNAAPETIYLKGTGSGIDTITRSFRFLQENWIEWFVPNALIIALLWFTVTNGWLAMIPGGMLTVSVIGGALLHVVMVFRGFLYVALDGSTHRQRMYKFRGAV